VGDLDRGVLGRPIREPSSFPSRSPRRPVAAARELSEVFASGRMRVRVGLYTGTPLLGSDGERPGDVCPVRAAADRGANEGGAGREEGARRPTRPTCVDTRRAREAHRQHARARTDAASDLRRAERRAYPDAARGRVLATNFFARRPRDVDRTLGGCPRAHAARWPRLDVIDHELLSLLQEDASRTLVLVELKSGAAEVQAALRADACWTPRRCSRATTWQAAGNTSS
jgi:hypothetical protein